MHYTKARIKENTTNFSEVSQFPSDIHSYKPQLGLYHDSSNISTDLNRHIFMDFQLAWDASLHLYSSLTGPLWEATFSRANTTCLINVVSYAQIA